VTFRGEAETMADKAEDVPDIEEQAPVDATVPEDDDNVVVEQESSSSSSSGQKRGSLWFIIIVPMILLVIVMFLVAIFLPSSTNGSTASLSDVILGINKFVVYPGYNATEDVFDTSGKVTVTLFPHHDGGAKGFIFRYDLSGVPPNCVNCGIHIHQGKTCSDANSVGGHYYKVDVDPWTTDGGAIYTSDGDGLAMGSFTLLTGYDTMQQNVGHAVVIHDQEGVRVSCGLLVTDTTVQRSGGPWRTK
jgi:Cu/Zn superoxide dismutase